MFEKGVFKSGKHSAFAAVTSIDVVENIKVEVVDGKLTLTTGDWDSYYALYQKLCQVTLSMKDVLVKEGSPRSRYSNLT